MRHSSPPTCAFETIDAVVYEATSTELDVPPHRDTSGVPAVRR